MAHFISNQNHTNVRICTIYVCEQSEKDLDELQSILKTKVS